MPELRARKRSRGRSLELVVAGLSMQLRLSQITLLIFTSIAG
jgi:hypothetical protein